MPVSRPSLSDWLNCELSDVLGFAATKEITDYILSIEDASDRAAYLSEMLDPANPRHRQLVEDFAERCQSESGSQSGSGAPQGFAVYRKKADVEEDSGQSARRERRKAKENEAPEETARKGKAKFVSLYSQDGKAAPRDAVMLSGRHMCECQSTKHKLVNNCVQCGRIVCSQEGSGPCLFCGSLVCTREEQEVLNRNSKKSEQLRKKLLAVPSGGKNNNNNNASEDLLAKAERHKNTLLEYDKSCEKRTQVIDDESDYFSVDSNKWLSKEQRQKLRKREEELRQKKHGSRLDRKITFDFAGRRVVEEDTGLSGYDPSKDDVVKQIMEEKATSGHETETGSYVEAQRKTITDGDGIVNPYLKIARPMIQGPAPAKPSATPTQTATPTAAVLPRLRLQDRELQELSDSGMCLSMHQPYASLLVAGIKKDEGRTWYGTHRGRLWIHAASREPTGQEVEQLEDMYRIIEGKPNLTFPTSYPTSCLLGSVDVLDCLSQEDYREKHPNGESASPYVFICANPQELLVKYPMSGQHKIYKLDPNIHQAAKKSAKKG